MTVGTNLISWMSENWYWLVPVWLIVLAYAVYRIRQR